MGLQMPGSVFAPDSSKVSWSWGHSSCMLCVSLGRRGTLSSQQLHLGSPHFPDTAGVDRDPKHEASASFFMADIHTLWWLQEDALHSDWMVPSWRYQNPPFRTAQRLVEPEFLVFPKSSDWMFRHLWAFWIVCV